MKGARVDGEEARGEARPGRFLRRVEAKSTDHRSGGPVVIVAFGDSVTMGATASGVLEPEAVYHHRLKRMLETRFPRCVFSVINAGIGGDTAADGLKRIDRDVLRYRPDLVLVGFGLNDATAGAGGVQAFEQRIGQIADCLLGQTQADVVLLTPNFMVSRENDAVIAEQRSMLPQFLALQNDGVLGLYAQAVRDVAARRGLPVADVHATWRALAERGVDTTAMLANGLNHPSGDAHELAAACVWRALLA